MPSSYPSTWIERVEAAPKLMLDPATGWYVDPTGTSRIEATVVQQRLDAYLKAEAARQRRRLSRDDERICRAYVLLVDNWQTSRPTRPSAAPATPPRPRTRARR